MSLPDEKMLAEALRMGRITAEQEVQLNVYLARHPEHRAAWEEELGLNDALGQLPALPVSTNFTARVVNAVRSTAPNQSEAQGRRGVRSVWDRWVPRLTAITALLALGLFSYHEHEISKRQDLARYLAQISPLASHAPVDLLVDFEAIQRLNQVPSTGDRELIAALQ